MKASDLNNFLKGLSTAHEFKKAIHCDASSYSELLEKDGAIIPLNFDEDEKITIDGPAIERLLQETLSKKLSSVDLAYICDCLTLGEKIDYEVEKARDIVFEIADPEINGGLKSDLELQQLIEVIKKSND